MKPNFQSKKELINPKMEQQQEPEEDKIQISEFSATVYKIGNGRSLAITLPIISREPNNIKAGDILCLTLNKIIRKKNRKK